MELNHFAVCLKLIQYCESTLLPIQNKVKEYIETQTPKDSHNRDTFASGTEL